MPGWEFAQGLGEVLVCTAEGETEPTINDLVRAIEPLGWVAVDSELRKQPEGAAHEEGTVGSGRKTR